MKTQAHGRWFAPALLLTVVLGLTLPLPASPLPAGVERLTVILIFFVQGLTLPTPDFAASLRRWPLHAAVQLTVFLLIPLLGLALDAIYGRFLPPALRHGLLYLCVLPSTVFMSIAITALAGGARAAAVVNAALSNVLGVILTPLWVAALLHTGGIAAAPLQTIETIAGLLLLPLLAGQGLRHVGVARFADAHERAFGNGVQILILLMLFHAFSETRRSGLWAETGVAILLPALACVLLLLALNFGLAGTLSRLLRLPPAERSVMLFCGAQKSLATGVPLAKILFAGAPGLGLLLLPLLIYHPLQLLLSVGLARRRFDSSANA